MDGVNGIHPNAAYYVCNRNTGGCRAISENYRQRMCAMNFLKNRLQLLAAIVLLIVIMVAVWYLFLESPGNDARTNGTLVEQTTERLVVL